MKRNIWANGLQETDEQANIKLITDWAPRDKKRFKEKAKKDVRIKLRKRLEKLGRV